jgi:hypothetical protein
VADKDSSQASLANALHEAEREYGRANAAPAGPNRIENINRACRALDEAQQKYTHCLNEQADPVIPIKR